MKKIIWKLTLRYCLPQLYNFVDSFKDSHYRDMKIEHERDAVFINYPLDTKVIVRSNEPDDLFIGTVVGYEDIGDRVMLKIKDPSSEKIIIAVDPAPPYWSKEREEALRKLNWAEQWNVMTKYYDINQYHQKNREKAYKK